MSKFQLPGGSRPASQRPAWSSLALVVEAMLLTLFLVASLSVLTGLFAAAAAKAGFRVIDIEDIDSLMTEFT